MLDYLDDWPDDALCGWMQQSSPPEYIAEEVKKRGILCTDGIASIDPNAHQIIALRIQESEIYDIVFSEDVLEELDSNCTAGECCRLYEIF